MVATHVQATISPLGWTAESASGVWVKELVAAESPRRDGFTLIRLAPEAVATLDLTDRDRLFVVSGPVELGDGAEPVRRHTGDYFALAARTLSVRAVGPAAVLLRLTGPALGGSCVDAYGPDGWFPAGPGVRAKLFIPLPADLSTFDERVAGLTWFEPGATSDRHPHPTAHRFLFLSGAAQDEVTYPDGRRENADRRAGDFVDYPTGVEHTTHSPDGCLLLFVHEARDPA